MTKRKTLIQRAAERFGIATRADVAQARMEGHKSGFRAGQETKRIRRRQGRWRAREAYNYEDGLSDDPASGDIAAGGFGYKMASGGVREPDITWEQNLKTAWDLTQSKGIVRRCSNIKRDYIWKRDIKPQAADEDLQAILAAFWEDNDMPGFGSEITRQWADYGAQVIPAFVRDSDGRVTLGYIDPDLIEKVVTHPENARQMWAVIVKPQRSTDKWVKETRTQVYRIIRKAEAIEVDEPIENLLDSGEIVIESRKRTIEATFTHPVTEKEEDVSGKLATAAQSPLASWEEIMLGECSLKAYSGDCFFLRKNADSNQTLGRSDHVPVADFVDQKDDALFDLGTRESIANMQFADVSIDGEEDKVMERAAEIRNNPPEPGSVNVHNTAETWNWNSPSLQQTASVETVKAQTAEIMGGEGYPVSWYGRGDETNRATAQAQGDPTWRTLEHDQGQIQAFMLRILEFVRDQAMIAGTYTPEVQTVTNEDGSQETVQPDTSITLTMPEMIARDMATTISALSAGIASMSQAVTDRAATQDAYIDLVAKILGELGISMDVDGLKDDAINEEQGKKLSGQSDAVSALFNRKSWESTHAALGDEEK